MRISTTRLASAGLFLFSLMANGTQARDFGQWGDADAEIAQWYAGLRQPDNPKQSCCGEADAYFADQIVVEGDKVFAIITDDRPDGPLGRQHVPVGTRIEVPAHKYKFDAGNPTGHTIIFLSLSLNVYCFVQNGGV